MDTAQAGETRDASEMSSASALAAGEARAEIHGPMIQTLQPGAPRASARFAPTTSVRAAAIA